MLGREVESFPIVNHQNMTMDIQHIAPGIYHLILKNTKGAISKKLVLE
jgi:hypothetical protein